MATSVVGTATVNSGTSITTTTLSITPSALGSPVAGDRLILVIDAERTALPTMSGPTLNTIGTVADTNGAFAVYDIVLASGDLTNPIVATWASARRCSMSAIIIRGGTTPVYSTFPTVGTHVAGATTGPSITPASDNNLLLSLIGGSTPSTPYVRTYAASGTGWTNDQNTASTYASGANAYTFISHKQLAGSTSGVSQTAATVTPSDVTNSVWTYALSVSIPAGTVTAPVASAAAAITDLDAFATATLGFTGTNTPTSWAITQTSGPAQAGFPSTNPSQSFVPTKSITAYTCVFSAVATNSAGSSSAVTQSVQVNSCTEARGTGAGTFVAGRITRIP